MSIRKTTENQQTVMNALDPRRHDMLDAMGIDVWTLRQPDVGLEAGRAIDEPREEILSATPESVDPIESLGFAALRARVAACTACELHRQRKQTVFGVGDENARCLVVGEAPGAEEDRQGEPFVGRAGQLLNAMLAAIGFSREQVYIANILKCRPPKNRDPEAPEVSACSAYLKRQIALIQPRVILAVGRVAAQSLLQTDTPIGRMRGQIFAYGENNIPLVVTYHPAYLLRSPAEKRKSWIDLQAAARLVREEAA